MRRFVNERGTTWDVVVSRESWGTLYALFVPAAGGTEPMRRALLQSAGYEEAQQELDGLEERALLALFAAAQPIDND